MVSKKLELFIFLWNYNLHDANAYFLFFCKHNIWWSTEIVNNPLVLVSSKVRRKKPQKMNRFIAFREFFRVFVLMSHISIMNIYALLHKWKKEPKRNSSISVWLIKDFDLFRAGEQTSKNFCKQPPKKNIYSIVNQITLRWLIRKCSLHKKKFLAFDGVCVFVCVCRLLWSLLLFLLLFFVLFLALV